MFTVTENYDDFDLFHLQMAEGIEAQTAPANEPEERWEAYSVRMAMEEAEEEGDEFTDFPLELLN